MTSFSPQQDAALVAVDRWLNDAGGPQVFRLFGFAGTGKTTLARHLAEGVDGDVLFAAFTGKAALVMRQKGCRGASTIHSLIYKLDDESAETGEPRFVLDLDSEVASASLVIVDECSMVGEDLARDLQVFGTKILVLGDPAQLPPVSGGGYFTNSEPDQMLTEVHRQAQDNPIIAMSIAVREGRRLERGDYGDSRVVGRGGFTAADVLGADQVLVGKNRTRAAYNGRIRELLGHPKAKPVNGDRLICLRNDRMKRLLNGGMWTVCSDPKAMRKKPIWKMDVASDEDRHTALRKIEVRKEFFEGTGPDLEWKERRGTDEFDFAYAVTVHKAQGSQWNNVMVFDESSAFGADGWRHQYTAITRAAERVTVVQS